LADVCETNFGFSALGNERFEAHGATFLRNRATSRRYDSNQVGLVRADDATAVDEIMRRAEAEYAGMLHRQFVIDALTPPAFQAGLVLEDGYRESEVLVHVLEGDLNAVPKDVEIREVLSEDDWARYLDLDAMWWKESGTSEEAFGPYEREYHEELMLSVRVKSPPARRWFACVEGVPRAFFCSWPGDNGVGMVEDLFCHPDYRNRGLATALIAHCVADARARGAGPVIINSDPRDTPKHIYARMGFRPLYVSRTYTKRLPAG
jgi:GNAT superfamily N-acetyltransferase